MNLIVHTGLMFAGILIATRIRQIHLGNFATAALKLAAISVAPGAIVTLAGPLLHLIPFGGLLALGIEFIFYLALIGALFDLDESDTWVCVWVIFLTRVAVYVALLYFYPWQVKLPANTNNASGRVSSADPVCTRTSHIREIAQTLADIEQDKMRQLPASLSRALVAIISPFVRLLDYGNPTRQTLLGHPRHR